MCSPPTILILGPTAGGKSELAVELAERLPSGGEVVGADSMQVYRHLEAGTAKPDPSLHERVPHHMIDIVEPTQRFTVHDWLQRARCVIDDVQKRTKHPIVVGGTNLYIQALLEGLFDGPPDDPVFRESLKTVPDPVLHERLRETDPAAAERIHPNDRKRLVRALEVHHATGQPISELQTQWDAGGPRSKSQDRQSNAETWDDGLGTLGSNDTRHATHDMVRLAIDWPVDAVNKRINARVKLMFYPTDGRESLPQEVQRLEAAGLLGTQAREALGYKQCLAALGGEMSLDEAFEKTKIATRRFAKQQRTWLRRFRPMHRLQVQDADFATQVDRLASQALIVAGQAGD